MHRENQNFVEEKNKKMALLSNSDLTQLFLYSCLYLILSSPLQTQTAPQCPLISDVELHGFDLLLHNHFEAFSSDSEIALMGFLFFTPLNPS